jgi:hypothetical protein
MVQDKELTPLEEEDMGTMKKKHGALSGTRNSMAHTMSS